MHGLTLRVQFAHLIEKLPRGQWRYLFLPFFFGLPDFFGFATFFGGFFLACFPVPGFLEGSVFAFAGTAAALGAATCTGFTAGTSFAATDGVTAAGDFAVAAAAAVAAIAI